MFVVEKFSYKIFYLKTLNFQDEIFVNLYQFPENSDRNVR